MDAKSLGPTIREWRIQSGLTQGELGAKAGIHKRIVGSIERGKRAPERWEIVELCRALGKAPSELITIWYRSCLNEFNELAKDSRRPSQPEEKDSLPGSRSRVNQIIDKMAALAKELYQESRDEFQKTFLDWLDQAGPRDSFPPPSSPKRARRRVSRKRGPTKA